MVSNNFFSALDDSEDEDDTPRKIFDAEKEGFNRFLNKGNPGHGKNLSNSEGLLSNERRRLYNNFENIKSGRGRPPHAREGRRYYDRQSGTGRGREVKKGGSGPHNWGSVKSEARKAESHLPGLVNNDEKVNSTETSIDENPEDNSKIVDNSTEVNEEANRSEEHGKKLLEEEKTMTLEEFLRSKTKPKSELFKPRNIKAVNNEFIGKTSRIAVKEDVLIIGKEKKMRKKNSKKHEKTTLDVAFFNPKSMNNNRRNGERVKRGGSRGKYDNRDRKSGVNVVPEDRLNAMDTMAFPSL